MRERKSLEEAEELERREARVARAERAFIRQEPSKPKRLAKMAWHWMKRPFVWIWSQRKDWRTVAIFAASFAFLSSPIWVFYILGLVSWGTGFSKWCLGIASAAWLFILGPGTPFMAVVIGMTVGIRALVGKIGARSHERKKKDEGEK